MNELPILLDFLGTIILLIIGIETKSLFAHFSSFISGMCLVTLTAFSGFPALSVIPIGLLAVYPLIQYFILRGKNS